MSERSEEYTRFLSTWARHCGAPASVFTGQLDVTIAAEVSRQLAALQRLADARAVENAALRAELRDEWGSNHREHCTGENDKCSSAEGGKKCWWPLPDLLAAQPDAAGARLLEAADALVATRISKRRSDSQCAECRGVWKHGETEDHSKWCPVGAYRAARGQTPGSDG